MNTFVSIIVPVYNAEKYIERCIYSAFNQTYKNIEIIAINDGSTDDTQTILEKMKIEDGRLVVIKKENEGVSQTRNVGLRIAKGDFICFLDSDDYYMPNYIETMLDKLVHNEQYDAATLINKTIRKNKLGNLEQISSKEGLDFLCQMKMPTSVWAYMYKRDLIKGIEFNPSILFFEDFLFNYIALSRARKIVLVKENLYYYESNPDGLNASKYNENKLSSINIVNLLFDDKTITHSKYLNVAYSYFIISNILFISKSNENLNKYYNVMKKHSQKCFFKLNPMNISYKFYLLTGLICISPDLAVKLLKDIYFKNKKIDKLTSER